MECSFKGRGDGNADGIWTFGITTAPKRMAFRCRQCGEELKPVATGKSGT